MAILSEVAPFLSWPLYVIGNTRNPDGKETVFSGVQVLETMPQKEIAKWFSRAAIYVLPAKYEPFGLTVLEAALAECAIVIGDIPSLREIWGPCALFVPPKNAGAILNTVQFLIENPVFRRELGEAARLRALELTPARMAEQYMHKYQQILKRSSLYPAFEMIPVSSTGHQFRTDIDGPDPDL